MALLKSSVKLVIREHAKYRFSGPALALGIPEIYASQRELQDWFPTLAGQECPVQASEADITTNEIGQKFGWVTSDTFFRALGISDVASIDLPDCEYEPDLVHDLNEPLPQDFNDRFNLIIDPGTLEHIFDIKTGFSNIVNALKVGGMIVQQLPIYSYNGGYYSLNPNVVNDFYRANGFDEIRIFIVMSDRYHVFTGKSRCYEYNESRLGFRHALADYDQSRFSPHLLCFARKVKELPGIVVPWQFEGDYVEGRTAEAGQKDLSLTTRCIRQVLKHGFALAYKLLPYPRALAIEMRVRRSVQVYRIQQQSFWI